MATCCTFSSGFKCTTVWCIVLSSLGIVISFVSAGWWAWLTATVSLALFSSIPCVSPNTGRILAAVASPFSFLTFILQATVSAIIISSGSIYCPDSSNNDDYYSSYYNNDDYYVACKNVSIALGSIGIIACMLWLAVAIISAVLACKISETLGSMDGCCSAGDNINSHPRHVAGTPKQMQLDHEAEEESDIEVANAFPVGISDGTSSVRIVEKLQSDGSKIVEKSVVDAFGNKTVTVTHHKKQDDEA